MFVPIQNTTHYSLLHSISNPESLVDRAAKLGYSSLGLTDYHSVSGAVEFFSECKKKKIKPLIGTKLRTGADTYLTVIAKNLAGWKALIKMISDSNDPENIVNDKAILSSEKLKNYDIDNLVFILGDIESELAHLCFSNYGYLADSEAKASLSISGETEEKVKNCIRQYRDLVDINRLFIQVNLLNNNIIPYRKLITDICRKVAKDEGIKCIAGINSHYCEEKDAVDHRLLVCSDQGSTFKDIDLNYWKNYLFFNDNEFCLPSQDRIKDLYLPEEIENTELINNQCEIFNITNKPQLPRFECPDGLSELEYLKQIAREGFQKKRRSEWDMKTYGDRAKTEFEVFEKADLSGYLLIVQDYVNWCKKQGWLIGHARGSAAGSLVSYLVGITEVDPIPYNLLFERFYNEGRNSGDNIEYPDIDVDFPMSIRENVFNYIRDKYSYEKTAPICTFNRIKGASAIREVLRIFGAVDSATINNISKRFPQESKIMDKLEEDQEESIIRWTLQNEPKLLEDFCHYNEKDELVGELAQYFEQAIRLEGVYKNQGKHAAGIVISKCNMDEVCPMIYHSGSKQKIAGFEMKSLQKAGLVKMDILGLACLDKLMMVKQLLRGNK